ncbi:MAG TPA: chemotaxis protein CheW [Terracidiphilus sp.]|nr:chemotaxis protein CheW [Terracidiphilus sp.]
MNETERGSLFERPMPAGYRDELRALMAIDAPKRPASLESIFLFQLGPLRLALPTRVASAVSPVLHVARIPHRSGTVLLGLVAFRGEILPCFSLAQLLDVAQSETGSARMLILEEAPGRLWAAPIDAVVGIRTIPEQLSEEQGPLPAHWLRGSFNYQSRSFYILDHITLFRQITLATA